MAHDVFISYASEDKATADAVCHGLEAQGIGCWMAPRDIPPGVEWPAAIVHAIAQSRAMVLMFSEHANQSHQVPRELERAVDKGIPIICMRLETVMPAASLEYFIGVVHWVDVLPSLTPSIARVAETIHSLTATTPRDDPGRDARPFRPAVELFQQRLRFRNALIVTSGAIAMVVSLLGLMSTFDLFTLDTRLASLTMWTARVLHAPALYPALAMVALERDIPRSAWRRLHATVVERLAEAGARVIAFDMYFESSTADDAALADAIARARQRGTAVVVGIHQLVDSQPKLLPELRQTVSAWGMLCIGQQLGAAWLEPLVVERGGASTAQPLPLLWSMALHAVAAWRQVDLSIDQLDPARQEILADHVVTHHKESFPFSMTSTTRRFQKGCPVINEGDRVHGLILALSPLAALRDPRRRFTYAGLTAATPRPDMTLFRDRIVLLGVESSDESFTVPGGERRFGFELHADAINTLLTGMAIRPLGQGTQLLLSVGLALLGGTVRYTRRLTTRRQRRLTLFSLVCSYVLMTCIAYSAWHVLLSPLYHLSGLIGTYVLAGKIETRWFT
ncbi:MAG: TIR domain-containing protein [Candidatus Tectomicrobia bacterium]|uniref:TIR domain-containing protein n=1 Tax=Tectimicrobiota bacterium TaxID=2528274 RepID=A0A937W1M4_UNCTE|nr:TIR domain-containing protein [Candidatus Tectomicrobia bacterium]